MAVEDFEDLYWNQEEAESTYQVSNHDYYSVL